jgi:hypothetical protein
MFWLTADKAWSQNGGILRIQDAVPEAKLPTLTLACIWNDLRYNNIFLLMWAIQEWAVF